MNFFHHQLSNGLEVVAETLPGARSISLGFFVRCGARNETATVSGVSHFLEHMIFKGSKTRSAQDVNREFDALGISFNAWTTEETTVFFASLLPEYLERCIEIYTDILRPKIRVKDFQSEKKVILEEIGMYENEPPFNMDERIRQSFFNGHPLGNPVLGTSKSVKKLTAAQLKTYFQKRYSPKNIALCACGCVDFHELTRLAEIYCGMWEDAECAKDAKCAENTKGAKSTEDAKDAIDTENKTNKTSCVPQITTVFSPVLGFETFRQTQASQQYLLSCSAASVFQFRERLAGRLLASVLGDDSGSRMYWTFIDSGLAEYALLNFCEYSDVGLFETRLCCEPEDAAKNWARLQTLLRSAENGTINEQELNLAKNRLATGLILEDEKAGNRVFSVGTDWILDREYRSTTEEVELLRSITLDEIYDYLRQFPLTNSLTYSVGP